MSVKVSVCVRTFNHEAFVAQAIQSALAQRTDFDFEIVIGDDASEDTTRTILRQLHEAHPERIKLLLQEANVGSRQNLIDVYAACKGEYVAFLDGDDFWIYQDKLQLQADYLDKHADVAICGTGFEKANEKPTFYKASAITLRDFIRGYTVMLQSTLMLRRRCLERIPDWVTQVKFADLTLQVLCLQGGKLAYMKEVTTFYRMHENASFSRLSPAEKIKWDVITWQEIQRHINPVYRRYLRRRLASAYYRLSECYKACNRLDESKAALIQAAKIGSITDRLRYSVRSSAPRLYSALLMLKQSLTYKL